VSRGFELVPDVPLVETNRWGGAAGVEVGRDVSRFVVDQGEVDQSSRYLNGALGGPRGDDVGDVSKALLVGL